MCSTGGMLTFTQQYSEDAHNMVTAQ